MKKKETFSQHLGLESRVRRSISQKYVPVHLSEPAPAKEEMSLERPELSSWPLRRPPEPSWPSKGEAFTGDQTCRMVHNACFTSMFDLSGGIAWDSALSVKVDTGWTAHSDTGWGAWRESRWKKHTFKYFQNHF